MVMNRREISRLSGKSSALRVLLHCVVAFVFRVVLLVAVVVVGNRIIIVRAHVREHAVFELGSPVGQRILRLRIS